MSTAMLRQAFVAPSAVPTRAQKPRPTPVARRSLICNAMKEGNDYTLSKGVSHALGALAAAQLVLGGTTAAPAFADVSFDSGKLGAPAQNKEATDLPSTFFKTGDKLEEKLGYDTNPQDLGNKIQEGSKSFNAVSQQDGKLNDVAKGAADATQKAAQNITPDLSELPDPTNLPNPFDDTGFADKVKGVVKDAASNIPDPSEAVDKAKGLGKEIGRNTPDASAAVDKAKGEAKGLANDLPNPSDVLRTKRI